MDPFPFFNLPELVIEKILKEYIPVSDKVTLSKMPEFKSYYDQKHAWFQPTLRLFQLVRSIKPGWYINCTNLSMRYYFAVDYFNLNFTFHTFCTGMKHMRSPVHIGPYQRDLSQVQASLNNLIENTVFIKEDDILAYHFEKEKPYADVYFLISRPEKKVFWTQDITFHQLKNNRCVILDGLENSYNVILKFNDDFTVTLYQVPRILRSGALHEDIVYPLSFQLCNEVFSASFDQESLDCASCKSDPNCIHAVCKQTFMYTDKNNVSISVTHFYEDSDQTFLIKKYMYESGLIFPNCKHRCFFLDLAKDTPFLGYEYFLSKYF